MDDRLNIIYVFNIFLKTGLSWSNLNNIIDNKLDSIRKRINKWCKLGIFINAHNILLKIYKNKYDITNMQKKIFFFGSYK